MKKKSQFWINLLKLTVIALAVFVASYSIIGFSLISGGNNISEVDLLGKDYISSDEARSVAFLSVDQAFYFDGEVGNYYGCTVTDGFVVLTSGEDIKVKFVALSESELFCPSVNSMFFLEESDGE